MNIFKNLIIYGIGAATGAFIAIKMLEDHYAAIADEEIEAEYGRIAEAYGMEIEKVKETVETDALAADMKVKKAVDLVKEKAVVTDAAPAADAE